MGKGIDSIVRLIRAVKRAYARKWAFLGVFVVIFLGFIVVLAWLDLLPEPLPPSVTPLVATTSAMSASASPAIRELPLRMEIPAIQVMANIQNPTTTAIASLDKELLKGAVRYPTSALLGEDGNVVLFGHSSYLPVVGNQAYKTFNRIQKLQPGDIIIVYSSASAYVYSVKNVSKASASDAAIPLYGDGRTLTLSTCDSFGAKTDRFIVTADFVESRAVPL